MALTIDVQRRLCSRFDAKYVAAPRETTLGISRNFSTRDYPLNGLRHPLSDGTSGWFIWSGESLSADADFFLPMHIWHLEEMAPLVLPYLGLAPGWRFLIAPKHEDVWWDQSLLNV